ncbi:chitin deacetylase 1 [Umbelopsis sp. PMI_123]|nr:chitin deacetylase 1 [Umbelopsis sp. PMI_123]
MYKLFASAALVATASAVTTNYTSTVDPTKINIPNTPQTTSYDVTTECTYYQPPVPIVASDWPSNWKVATTNGMNTTAEYTALYNSIDWTKVPNIQPHTMGANGALVTTGYDTVNDPDCWWTATQCVTPKAAGVLKDISACPEPETWGLTYDDGPNCSHNAFYDFLQQQNLKASMFYIGSNVMNWPYGAQRGVKDGHHIAVHTWSHPMMTTLSNQDVLAELYYATKMIKYVTGLTPLYWRPPLGDVDDRVRWIASQLNLTAIIWNRDTDDWAAGVTVTVQQVQQNYQNFITEGTNGTFANTGNIVLSHEINNMTMGFAEQYIPNIKKAYKNVVDVATCMNITNPYVESTVTFAAFGGSSNGGSVSPGGTSSNSKSAASGTQTNAALAIAAAFAVLAFF